METKVQIECFVSGGGRLRLLPGLFELRQALTRFLFTAASSAIRSSSV